MAANSVYTNWNDPLWANSFPHPVAPQNVAAGGYTFQPGGSNNNAFNMYGQYVATPTAPRVYGNMDSRYPDYFNPNPQPTGGGAQPKVATSNLTGVYAGSDTNYRGDKLPGWEQFARSGVADREAQKQAEASGQGFYHNGIWVGPKPNSATTPNPNTGYNDRLAQNARKAGVSVEEYIAGQNSGRFPIEGSPFSGGSNYNVNPAPTGGQGPYGAVPGPIGVPNAFGDLASLYPNLGGTNAAVSSNIASQLAGELSPATQAAIQDAAARFGVGSGMPGAGLARNRTVRDLGLAAENQVQRGLGNYNAAVAAIKGTQTVSPETQIGVADRNSVYGAAPDPNQAAAASQALFNQYLKAIQGRGSRGGGAGGSPAGGTGWYNPTSSLTAPPTPSSGIDPWARSQVGPSDYGHGTGPGYFYNNPGEVPYNYAGNPQDLVGVNQYNYANPYQPTNATNNDWGYEDWMSDY